MLNWLQIDLTEISAQASNLITYKVAKLITSEIKGYINRLSNKKKNHRKYQSNRKRRLSIIPDESAVSTDYLLNSKISF